MARKIYYGSSDYITLTNLVKYGETKEGFLNSCYVKDKYNVDVSPVYKDNFPSITLTTTQYAADTTPYSNEEITDVKNWIGIMSYLSKPIKPNDYLYISCYCENDNTVLPSETKGKPFVGIADSSNNDGAVALIGPTASTITPYRYDYFNDSNTTFDSICFGFYRSPTYAFNAGLKTSFSRLLLINLTDCFGSGNEPQVKYNDDRTKNFNDRLGGVYIDTILSTQSNRYFQKKKRFYISDYLHNSNFFNQPPVYPIEIPKLYIGESSAAKKIIKGYYGDSNGKAKQFYEIPAGITFTDSGGNNLKYKDENVIMDGDPYRLLTFDSSGTLQFDRNIPDVDIWICGAGGSGNTVSVNTNSSLKLTGGGGGYVNQITSTSFDKNYAITIAIGQPRSYESTTYYGAGSDTQIIWTRLNQSSNTTLLAHGGNKNKNGQYGSNYAGYGGSGGGTCRNTSYLGLGVLTQDSNYDIQEKPFKPFNSNYFPFSFCDGGGGGIYWVSNWSSNRNNQRYGGNGGSNGTDGTSASNSSNSSSHNGGGAFGGRGAKRTDTFNCNGSDAFGYGSGGGCGGVYSNTNGSQTQLNNGLGFQGVCFIRIPLFDRS